ncbi:MAG: hypothetical protein AAB848_03135 [Patescibacteria group bacterium]
MEFIKSAAHYLFSRNPGTQFKFYIPLIILICLLFLGALAFSVIYKNKKKTDFAFKHYFKKTAGRLFWIGFLFLFLVLVRYENIPYFSMRILMYLSLLLSVYFIYKTAKTFLKDYPREKQNVQSRIGMHEHKELQYLPNKKKKR